MACYRYIPLLLIWFFNFHDIGFVTGRVLSSEEDIKQRDSKVSLKLLNSIHHRRFRRAATVLNCSKYAIPSNPAPDNRTKIHIGLLLPFVLSSHGSEYKEGGARFYSEAFTLAVKRINEDPTVLPGYKLDFVFNDTRCNELDNIRAMYFQYKSRNRWSLPVHGFIGLGCQCSAAAKFASAMKVPVVSHVSVLFS